MSSIIYPRTYMCINIYIRSVYHLFIGLTNATIFCSFLAHFYPAPCERITRRMAWLMNTIVLCLVHFGITYFFLSWILLWRAFRWPLERDHGTFFFVCFLFLFKLLCWKLSRNLNFHTEHLSVWINLDCYYHFDHFLSFPSPVLLNVVLFLFVYYNASGMS